MEENFEEALNELKRVDHLIHVSLKYTRTVDVLISVLKRFISCTDFIINVLYIKAIEDKKTETIPDSPVAKAINLKNLYEEEYIKSILEDYLLWRRLIRAEYTKRQEFRRYVTMTVEENGTIVEIDIDRVYEYYAKVQEFVTNIKELISN